MSQNSYDIAHPEADWSAEHEHSYAGGLLHLSAHGNILLSNFHCRYDDMDSSTMTVDKSRCFRKSGAAVCLNESHTPYGGLSFKQSLRYTANYIRVTHDLNWPKQSELRRSLEIGSAQLPGHWHKMLLFDIGTPGYCEHELLPGTELCLDSLPLAMVFYNQQGQALEIGSGNDLWRWQKGLQFSEGQANGKIVIKITEEALQLQRKVSLNQGETALLPLAREYRFTSYIAWSCPTLGTKLPAELQFCRPKMEPGKGLKMQDLSQCGSKPAISLDFSQLLLPRQAARNLSEGLCWESKITQKFARRIIRQLADLAEEGYLLIETGIFPGLCQDPVHCSRKEPALHWDLVAILDFCSWMRQKMGEGWRIKVQVPEPWCKLPSMSCLGAINGFRNQEEL
ncbi:MAG: hypothetical protein GX946_03150 [Oligosphaeraceae bacterium]|nr:hypothetical protein [Oligosphaeraceae bacterium]